MKTLLPTMFAVAFINFLAFFVIAGMIGGDAMNGKIANGHYFLGSHGRFTEVSAGLFTYSLWHVRSLFVTHPLGMLAGGILAMKASKRMGNRN